MKNNKTSSKKKEKKKKIKKSEEKKKEETKLEEEVKDAEKEIEKEHENEQQPEFFEPVRQIPISTETAPVLERIIERQTQEQIIPPEDFANREKAEQSRERRVDYSPVSNQPNYGFQRDATEENREKKYESAFVPPVLSRREIFREEMKQEFLRPQQEVQNKETDETLLEGIEILKQDMMPMFGEEEKKYKRHRLR